MTIPITTVTTVNSTTVSDFEAMLNYRFPAMHIKEFSFEASDVIRVLNPALYVKMLNEFVGHSEE